MPTGPNGEKRSRDVIAAARQIALIATGEAKDPPRVEKDPAAVSLGKKGGAARAKALSPAMRKAIASDAARKRWDKAKPTE